MNLEPKLYIQRSIRLTGLKSTDVYILSTHITMYKRWRVVDGGVSRIRDAVWLVMLSGCYGDCLIDQQKGVFEDVGVAIEWCREWFFFFFFFFLIYWRLSSYRIA